MKMLTKNIFYNIIIVLATYTILFNYICCWHRIVQLNRTIIYDVLDNYILGI